MASSIVLNDGTSVIVLNDGTSELLLNVNPETGTDGAKGGEATAVTINFTADVRGENAGASDTATQQVRVYQTGTDGAVAGDSASSALGVVPISVSGTDGGKGADDASQIIRTPQTGTDGATGADTSTNIIRTPQSGTDGAKGADTGTQALRTPQSGTDGGVGSDSASAGIRFAVSGTDGAKGADTGVYLKSLYMQRQPSEANVGLVFRVQPNIGLLGSDSNVQAISGISVTASVQTGSGVLGGTLVAVTDGSGVAYFSDLEYSIAESGVVLRFTSQGLDSVDSAPFDVTAGEISASDGAKGSDSATGNVTGASVTYPVTGADGGKAGEARAITIAFSLPSDVGVASDSATARRVSQATDGARASDTATSRMNPWHLTATDGAKASDSGDIGQRRVSASDGAKASDTATNALGGGVGSTYQESGTDGAKVGESGTVVVAFVQPVDISKGSDVSGIVLVANGPYDGARGSDNASSALGAGGGLQQTVTDGAKAGEARRVSVSFSMPVDIAKAGDSATANVRTGTIAITQLDGARAGDSALIKVVTANNERAFGADDLVATFIYQIPDEGGIASDSATSNVAGRIIVSATDGGKGSDTATSRAVFRSAGTDGARAGDSASASIAGVLHVTGADGAKASDAAGTAHTSQAVPFEGARAGDSASSQLTGAFVYHEVGQDGGKAYDAAGPTIRATGPYDGAKAHEFATSSVKVRVSASDGAKASDIAFGSGERFATDGAKATDFAYANIVGGCVTAVTITYTCVSDPSVTTEVSCVTPLNVPHTEVG